MPANRVEGNFSFEEQQQSQSSRVKRIAFFVFIVLFMLNTIIATQLTAWMAGYSRSLGKPLFYMGKTPIYSPAMLTTWINQLSKDKKTASVGQRGMMAFLIGIFANIGICKAIIGKNKDAKFGLLHGSAKWATKADLIRLGLIPNPKKSKQAKVNQYFVYIGGWYDKAKKKLWYLKDATSRHIMVMASTGSGKGVGLVLTTLFGWAGSIIVLDIKKENFYLTAGVRKSLFDQHIIRLDPSDPSDSHATFNPLAEIRLKTPYEVADAQNISSMLVDPDGEGLKDHWAKTAFDLLTGAILHCMYKADNDYKRGLSDIPYACMYDIVCLLSDPQKAEWRDIFTEWIEYGHNTDERGNPAPNPVWDGAFVHPIVAQSAADMIGRADAEATSVLSSAKSYLTLYRDPVLAKNTRISSFRISDITNADKPVSLYLTINPADIDRLRPFIRLFLNQVVKLLANEMEYENGRGKMVHKYPLLMLLDEFPQLGRMEIVEKGLAYVRSFGIRFMLIAQGPMQIEKAYGKESSILSNSGIRVFFGINTMDTAELVSKSSGMTTAEMTSESVSGKKGGFDKTVSIQTQAVARNLLTPDECMRLPQAVIKDGKIIKAGSMLIFYENESIIHGQQVLYFRDPIFSEWATFAAPSKSDILQTSVKADIKRMEPENVPSPQPEIEELQPIDGGAIEEEAQPFFEKALALKTHIENLTPEERNSRLKPLFQSVLEGSIVYR